MPTNMYQQRGITSISFFLILSMFITHGEGLQKIKCNIENSSTVLLSCRSNEQIFIKSIFYHQPTTECQGTGSCKRRVRTDDSNFSPICQYKYGDCNQTLDTTVLNHCKTDNLSIAAEVDYDCRVKQDEDGTFSIQQIGSNTSNWIADMSCPPQTFIYITSIEYWTLDNSTCQSDPLMIREELLKLNHLCKKQQKCQPPLLYNITTTDGCRLEWPNVGSKVNYMCIGAIDVCSDIVRTPNDSLASLYLTTSSSTTSTSTSSTTSSSTSSTISSTSSSSTPGIFSSCRCQVYGKEMTVKILYLNLPAVSSVRGDLYFTPPSDSPLNLTTPQVNTTVFSNVSNVTVTFNNINISGKLFLIEYKELTNSFLHLTCLQSEIEVSMSSIFTSETTTYSDTTTSKHGPQEHTKKTLVIGGAVGGGLLIILIVIIVILIGLRKHNKKNAESVLSETPKIPSPVYFELEICQNNSETSDEKDEHNSNYETILDFIGVENLTDSNRVLTINANPNSISDSTSVHSVSNQTHMPSNSNSQERVTDFEVLENELYVPLELSQCASIKNVQDRHFLQNDSENIEKISEDPEPVVIERFTGYANGTSDFEIFENEQYVSFDEIKTEGNTQLASTVDNDFEVLENELYVPLELDTEYNRKEREKCRSSNYEKVDI